MNNKIIKQYETVVEVDFSYNNNYDAVPSYEQWSKWQAEDYLKQELFAGIDNLPKDE